MRQDYGKNAGREIKSDIRRLPQILLSAAALFLYYYLIESFKKINEDNLMQSEDNDDGGLTPTEEADEAMRKLDRLELNISIK